MCCSNIRTLTRRASGGILNRLSATFKFNSFQCCVVEIEIWADITFDVLTGTFISSGKICLLLFSLNSSIYFKNGLLIFCFLQDIALKYTVLHKRFYLIIHLFGIAYVCRGNAERHVENKQNNTCLISDKLQQQQTKHFYYFKYNWIKMI